MDLTHFAQLGEFIGGIGVFVTLIYLTIQVRQSNALQATAAQLARAEAQENASGGWSAWRQMLTDSELSSIWRRAHASEALTPDEKPDCTLCLQNLPIVALPHRLDMQLLGLQSL